MKRFFKLFILFVCVVNATVAQQRPQYTQYVFNNYLINPAVTGIENYTDIKMGYRSQWTGIQGAPVTSFITFNAPIGDNFLRGDAAAGASGNGENPLGRSYTQNYMAAEPHHGVGLMILEDKAGLITQTDIAASYAYHLGLSPTLNLAVGVSADLIHSNLNTAELTIENPNDAAILNGTNNQWNPELSVGVWGYSALYYIGVSVQQLLPENLYFSTNRTNVVQNKAVPHYFFTGGYKLFVSDDVTLMPSIMLKLIKPVPTSYDINAKLAFRDRFWIGGSYRKGDSFSGLIGLNINSLINIGYAYDATTSALNTMSNGSHEIVISLMLNNRYKVTCPKRTF
jgi:type IX secretion system PorP/SprF family membrane protein